MNIKACFIPHGNHDCMKQERRLMRVVVTKLVQESRVALLTSSRGHFCKLTSPLHFYREVKALEMFICALQESEKSI